MNAKDFNGGEVNSAAFHSLAAHGVDVRWAPAGYIFHIKATTFDGKTSDISTANDKHPVARRRDRGRTPHDALTHRPDSCATPPTPAPPPPATTPAQHPRPLTLPLRQPQMNAPPHPPPSLTKQPADHPDDLVL